MTTHTWKSYANGFVFDPTLYTDGQAFSSGDTLIAHSGTLGAVGSNGQVGALDPRHYVFDISATNATLSLGNLDLDASSTLQESGGGPLRFVLTDQFINDGTFQIGTPSASGTVVTDMFSSTTVGGFTNDGQLTIQNESRLRFDATAITANFLNSAGATITIKDGSLLDWEGSYSAGNAASVRNDGLIIVSATSEQGSALTIGSDYSGTGTVSVMGVPGALPSDTQASFDYSTSGTFDIASGALTLGRGHPVNGTINFYDNDGVLNIKDDPVSESTASFAPLGATINGFQAGDQILLNGYAVFKSYNYDQASHTLKLYAAAGDQGSVLAQLTLAGNYTTGDFQVKVIDSSHSVGGLALGSNYAALISTTSTRNAETGPALPPTTPQPSPPAAGSPGTPPPASASVINSTAAGDVVTAGAGNVIVYASGSSATVNGGSGNLTFVAGSGSYSAGGGAGTDILYGGAGADLLTGGGGANSIIVAGSGNTSLVGGAGSAALMFGGTAVSTFTSSTGGADTLIGGAGANVFNTSNGDVVFGGPTGPDVVNAGEGSTLLVEGTGPTRVNVSGSSVTAFAGTGADTYAITRGAGGGASIIGFKAGDHLTLTGGFTAADAASALRTASTGSFGTALQFADGTQVTLFGASLGASQISVG